MIVAIRKDTEEEERHKVIRIKAARHKKKDS